jgi:hypothetical protein
MTLQEQISAFGKDAMLEVCQDKIMELSNDIEFFNNEADYLYKDYLRNMDDSVNWFYKMRIEKSKFAANKVMKSLTGWRTRAMIIAGGLDGRQVSLDLNQLKSVPCSNFLAEPKIRGHDTLHYLAPWRDETHPSLVVYTKDNRWWDFGEGAGGSVIDLIMKKEGLDFKQALNYLKSYI